MSGKVLGENVTFAIEVEDNPRRVLLVFDRKCDYAIVPWEDAFRLAEVMEKACYELCDSFEPTNFFVTLAEQAQVKLNHHKGLVALLVEWTDRLSYTSLDAWFLTARAIRKASQDANLELRGVHLSYDREGMIRKITNSRLNYTQKVR